MKTVMSLVDTHLNSTAGYSAVVRAGVPKEIPDVLVPTAVKHGCKVLDESPEVVPSAPVDAPAAAASKKEKIGLAIAKIVASGDPAHFKADGSPNTRAVRAMAGDDSISAADVFDVWSEIQMDEKIEGELVPDEGEVAPQE